MLALPTDLRGLGASQPQVLTLTCSKCTRQEAYRGESLADASEQAKKCGWIVANGKMICPKCPARRA